MLTKDWKNDFRRQYDELGLKSPKKSMPGLERELIVDYFSKLIDSLLLQERKRIREEIKKISEETDTRGYLIRPEAVEEILSLLSEPNKE